MIIECPPKEVPIVHVTTDNYSLPLIVSLGLIAASLSCETKRKDLKKNKINSMGQAPDLEKGDVEMNEGLVIPSDQNLLLKVMRCVK